MALRGELWQRHALLQTIDRGEARYDEQSAELIELTAELLKVEAEVARATRAARRRAGWIAFAMTTVLLLAAVWFILAPRALGLGPATSRLGAGVALLAVLVVLVVTALIRRRYSLARLGRKAVRATLPDQGVVPSPGRSARPGPDPEPAAD